VWEAVGTFVGIPLAVLALIALPIFGPEWWHRHHGDNDIRD
jgi:ABC-type transport system involved in cytochrome c biogenesis permease subunit